MAAPAVASSTSASSGSGLASSLVITVPSGTSNGDLLIAFLGLAPTATPTAPSGWTPVVSGGYLTSVAVGAWYRTASSEPADYTWTWTGNLDAVGGMIRVTGNDGAPYVSSGNGGASNTLHRALAVTTTSADNLLIAAYCGTSPFVPTYTPPTGMTEVIETSATFFGTTLEVNRQDIAASGSTGVRDATASTNSNFGAIMLAVAPAAAAFDATVTPAAGDLRINSLTALTGDNVVFPAAGAMAITGQTVTLATSAVTVTPAAGALVIAGPSAGAYQGSTLEVAAGALTFAGYAVTVVASSTVSPAVGALTVAGPISTVDAPTTTTPAAVVTVEFSPTTGPNETPAWVDISDRVRAVTFDLGRDHALEGSYRPGTATVAVANEDRRFDPEHAAGPYYETLTPGRRIRGRVTYDGVTYPIFGCFVEGWPQTYQFPELADTQIPATDGLTLLGWAETNASPLEAKIAQLAPRHWWRLDEKAGALEVADSGTGHRTGRPIGGAEDNLGFEPGVDRISEASCLQLRNAGGGYINVTGAAEWVTFAALAKGDPVAGQGLDYLWSSTDGSTHQFVGMYGNTGRYTACDGTTQRTTAGAYNDGAVHLVVVTSDAGTCNIYIDGVLDNGQQSLADTAPNGSKAYIGNHVSPNNTKWNGKVGHVALWTSALTATQVADLQETIVGWDEDSSGDRVNNLLDLAGWPQADRNITTVGALLGPVNGQDWTGDVLDNINVVAASEAGQFYQQPDYVMRFRARTDPLTDPRSNTSRYTFSDDPSATYHYEDITFGEQSAYLHNRIKVTYSGGEVTVTDDASVAAYGPRDFSLDTALPTAGQARNLAEAVLYQYAHPRLIVESIVLNPAADPRLWLPCLDLQVGDRVTVRKDPQGVGDPIEVDVIVEGITGRLGDGVNEATWTLRLSAPMSPGGPGGGGGGDNFWIWGTGEWGTAEWA